MFAPIVATLCYVLDAERRVLLVHRVAKPTDAQYGKYNGIGGKIEAGEDVVSGARREIREETGLTDVALRLRGTIAWPGFGKNGEDWLGFVFLGHAPEGVTVPDRNDEGELAFHDVSELPDLPMNPSDRHWLEYVFSPLDKQFHGVFPYQDGHYVGPGHIEWL